MHTMRRLILACWLGCVALLLPAPAGADSSVAITELPPEASRTLRLIERGGPFPYARDGVAFGNFEQLLPHKPRGYYREYTVPTPGRRDRGARRIVAGEAREYFYSDDHYRSFRKIRP
ncbi:MAG: ribonuclease domain-containing protein [Sterolibacterium sp.]|jgi:ribonuclease T1